MTLAVTIATPETPTFKPETPAVVTPVVETPAANTKPLVPNALNPTNPTVKPDARPAWLPEKFKDVEQMALAYGELEKKLGVAPVEKPVAETKPVETPVVPEVKPVAEVRTEVSAKGIDFDTYVKEYADKGALTPESYAKLTAAGYDKGTVDSWIAGQVALGEKRSGELFEIVGGKDNFGKVSAWAQANMQKSEIEAFNRAVSSGDQDMAKLAVTGLNAKFTAANGSEPTLVGGSKDSSGADTYRSRAELTTAIKDPRYSKDPAYRSDVEAKAIRSNI